MYINLPRLSATEKSTPFDNKILQTSAKPFSAATCNAVCPPVKQDKNTKMCEILVKRNL